jgi:hypothetical protein
MAILLLLFSFYAVAVILNEKDKAKQNQWEPNVCDGQQFTEQQALQSFKILED